MFPQALRPAGAALVKLVAVVLLTGCGIERAAEPTRDSGVAPEPKSDATLCSYSDPQKKYFGKSAAECAVMDFRCAQDEQLFQDACGCGCQKAKTPAGCKAYTEKECTTVAGCYWFRCPPNALCDEPDHCATCDYQDPLKRYLAQSPLKCAAMDYRCPEGEESFSDGCGCGCAQVKAPSDPCPGLPEDKCLATDGCVAGYAGICDCTCPGPFGYEGGGCEHCPKSCFIYGACVLAATHPVCDHHDPLITWIGYSQQECAAIDFGCQAGETAFENVCGCGCKKTKP